MDCIQQLRRWKRLDPSHYKKAKKFTLSKVLTGLPCRRNLQLSFEVLLMHSLVLHLWTFMCG